MHPGDLGTGLLHKIEKETRALPGEGMVDPMTTYRITIEPDDNGWWTVSADDVRGAHSHGQTLARARTNIREPSALMEDLPEGAEATMELEERIVLPEGVRDPVEYVHRLRAEAERINLLLRAATNDALDVLEACMPELGLRDQADLVGVSFQRVAQLRPGAPRGGRRSAPARS
jgi:predicted RNase H-like HicB family nuclease